MSRINEAAVAITAAVVIALLDYFISHAHSGWPPIAIVQIAVVIVFVTAAMLFVIEKKVALLVALVAAVLVLNHILFSNNFITFFNFGEFAAETWAWPAMIRVSSFVISATLTVLAARARRRVWLYLLIAVLLIATIPSKLSSSFFI